MFYGNFYSFFNIKKMSEECEMPFFEKIDYDIHVEIVNYKKWPKFNDAHFHDCYELYYLLEGSVNYLIGNTVFSVNPYDLVWVPKNVLHKTRPNKAESFKRLLIYIDPKIIKTFSEEDPNLNKLFSNTNIFRFSQNRSNKWKEILGIIANEYNKADTKNMLLIKSYLGILFVEASQLMQDAETHKIPEENDIPEKLNAIIRYINANYFNDISLETLSREFYFHPVYISTLIKKHLGITFSEYLNKVRIQKSIHLLKNSTYSITDVSTICGFNSANHYCKIFKTYMNVSPSQFRKALQQVDI